MLCFPKLLISIYVWHISEFPALKTVFMQLFSALSNKWNWWTVFSVIIKQQRLSVSPGTRVEWGDGCEASRQLRGSQYDKTLEPPLWDTSTALEKLYWPVLEPSARWDTPRRSEVDAEEDEEEEEGTELLPAWAIRALSSCREGRFHFIFIYLFIRTFK